MQGCGVVETRTGSLRPCRIGGAGDEVVVLGGAHGPDAQELALHIRFSTVRADIGIPAHNNELPYLEITGCDESQKPSSYHSDPRPIVERLVPHPPGEISRRVAFGHTGRCCRVLNNAPGASVYGPMPPSMAFLNQERRLSVPRVQSAALISRFKARCRPGWSRTGLGHMNGGEPRTDRHGIRSSSRVRNTKATRTMSRSRGAAVREKILGKPPRREVTQRQRNDTTLTLHFV